MGSHHFYNDAVAKFRLACHLRWLGRSLAPQLWPCLGFRRTSRFLHQVARFGCECAVGLLATYLLPGKTKAGASFLQWQPQRVTHWHCSLDVQSFWLVHDPQCLSAQQNSSSCSKFDPWYFAWFPLESWKLCRTAVRILARLSRNFESVFVCRSQWVY